MIKTVIYFFAKALQLLGLATITYVVLLFFGKTEMKPLLYLTLTGISEFYGGYLLLMMCDEK